MYFFVYKKDLVKYHSIYLIEVPRKGVMNKVILPIVIILLGSFLLFNDLSINDKKEQSMDFIAVDIKGAISNPGVYKMERWSRLSDLIDEAGGLRFDASTRYINLSKMLEDEMVVVIYTDSEIDDLDNSLELSFCNCPEVSNDTCFTSEENNKAKININTASLDELMTLSGIGKSKAQSIIDYRTNNGNFLDIKDIMNVKGIGNGVYEKIKDFITV